MVHESSGGEAVSVVVNRLVLTADIDPNTVDLKDTAESIVKAMDSWWDTVRTWLEIVTGQNLTKIGHEEDTIVLGNKTPIWVVTADGSAKDPFSFPITVDLSLRHVNAVTADVLQGCLSVASNGFPALAWTLLRDGRSLYKVHQYRRALIDAATAAEGRVLDPV